MTNGTPTPNQQTAGGNPVSPTISSESETRSAFYAKIDTGNCAPLWEVLSDLVRPTPKTPCLPYIWHWDKVSPWIEESGQIISAAEAERRVIVLENPGLRGRSAITHSLYAGLQLILPGEVAPAHRHTQSALRFILQGSGAYTSVGGERITMRVGDFVITPSWQFHDHGNPSDEPMVWLDGLDIPIVELFDAQFMERTAEESQQTSHGESHNLAQFGNTMKPVGFEPASSTSPLCWYPFERTRGALQTLKSDQTPHPCWGHKLQYLNPLTGKSAMPTIATFMQILPAGFKGQPYRATDSTVYAVVEGCGTCTVDGEMLEFGPRDVFICPSWMPYTLSAPKDAILFSFSDRPVQQALDLWRESF